MTPKEFEQQISKIQKVLEGQGAKVTWNARIPDPDNPSQLRQIDVLIEKGKEKTIVECRLHFKPQDVKWIEEIFGRKISLNAQCAIAVSASGFTKGAINKANRFGVVLRDFSSLTDQEIESWGQSTKVKLEYIKFDLFEIYIVFPEMIIKPFINTFNMFKDEDGDNWPVEKIFNFVANIIDKNRIKLRNRRNKDAIICQLYTKKLYIGGVKIDELIIQCKFKRLSIPYKLPVVKIYGSPVMQPFNKEVLIEASHHSKFEIYHTPKYIFPIADLSVVEPIQSAIFRSICFQFNESVPMCGIGIIGQKETMYNLMPFKFLPIHKEGRIYNDLLKSVNKIKLLK